MKRNLWLTALLILSILAVSASTLAMEPTRSASVDSKPLARPLDDRQPQLLEPPSPATIKGLAPPATTGPLAPAAEWPAGVWLHEGFESGTMPPPGGWSVINTNPSHNWAIVNSADLVHGGSYAAWVNYDAAQVSDEWLFTPAIDLTGTPDALFTFWAYSDTNWCPNGGTGANMLLHVTNSGGTPLATVWDMCNDENWTEAIYRQVTVDLSAYAGQTIKLAWQYTGLDGQSFGLDDVLLLGSGGTPVVDLEPEYQKKADEAGTTAVYDLTLWNFTDQADSFNISYTGNAWTVTGPAVVGPVARNGSASFQVQVSIPGNAVCPDCDTVVVTAQAQATSAASDTVTIETCAGENWHNGSTSNAQATHWMAYTCTDAVGAQGTCFYFGGLGPGNAITAYSQKYDIATGTWTRIADMPTPAFLAVAGYINGKVYVVGGFIGTTSPWPVTGVLRIYDVASNSWTVGPVMPIPRGGAAGGAVGGKLYVAGGQDQIYEYRHLHEYDPATGIWSEKTAMPDFVRFGAGATSTSHLYVGGGYFGENGFFEYDPALDAWEEKAPLPGGAGKKSPVMAAVPDCGGVFLYGGDLGAWNGYQASTWYWHPAANAWVDYGMTMNTATTGAGGGLAHGRLWSFGGSQGAGPLSPPPHESLAYCCPAAPPTGSVAGVVTDANTGQPIANASIYLSSPSDPNFEDGTWTSSGGSYSFDFLSPGQYKLRTAAYGYVNQEVLVDVVGDGDLTQNFVLAAARPTLTPAAVGISLAAGDTTTWTLHLENEGSAALVYHISELPADGLYDLSDLTLPTGLDPQLSAELSQAAEGTAEFMVYMAEQADLSEAFAIKDRSARGWYVLNALRATAERSQADLQARLKEQGIRYRSHYIVNAIAVQGNLALAQNLAARPDVAYVGVNHTLPAPAPAIGDKTATASPQAIEWNILKVRADQVWSDPNFGTDGAGITVANIDTGVQWNHPALINQYRGGAAGNHDYNWWDPYGHNPAAPYDFHGHGTHTMGTMVGDDGGANQIGMAPGATWFACEGFDQNTGVGYEAELLECAEFVLAPWDLTGANPDPDKRADVVNNSWGGGQAQWWYNQVVYAWRAAGIFPLFAAGNDGPTCDTVSDPGDMANVLTVGATDSSDSNAPSSGASFSGRGPAQISGLTKPNVSAPGANIRSSVPGSGYESGWSGTSMATPHVAGEVALIWAAQPDLRGNVQLTQQVIEQTAKALSVDQGYYCGSDTATSIPNNQYGWGRIDAYEAVSTAVYANWDIGWLTVISPNGVVSPAAGADLVLAFDSTGLTGGQCYNGHLKVEYNDPYLVEQFVPVALCVDLCLGLDDLDVTGPAWVFVGHSAEYQAVADPITASLPITIEWSGGTSGPTASYTWTTTGTYTLLVTGTNCGGADTVTRTLSVDVVPVHPIYLPLVLKNG